MNVIVVGAGHMGRGLAERLCRQGHNVTVIDRDVEELDELSEGFRGERVVGVGFDREVLARAGVERASAVIACTSSDEANIVIARVARGTYRVPRVIARLYDISKAEAYRRLGIQTISTTDWGIRHACELLTYQEMDTVLEVGSGDVQLVRTDVPALLEGRPVRELSVLGEIQVVAISRNNETFLPTLGTVLEHGDVVYAAVASSASSKFAHILGRIG
ncbi:potassium channel family protein [Olsenella profusa]|uniref:Trk system potassium uptake protein TrkA n=1 Tax=Olsenella profusa TaxID=138595 RepID=A0ABS2F248_9ACTN|nr:TrkA family potassium uptake protein [Olsenella profusa]MBM6775059.1 TrkA family potassium uptake protein [Olsenella profusa]